MTGSRSFSNRGNLTRSPDLVAPGRAIVSLRSPGSFIDQSYPSVVVNDAARRPPLVPWQRDVPGRLVRVRSRGAPARAAPVAEPRPSERAPHVDGTPAARGSPDDAGCRGARRAGGVGGEDAADRPLRSAGAAVDRARVPRRGPWVGCVASTATGAVLSGEQDIFGVPWLAEPLRPSRRRWNLLVGRFMARFGVDRERVDGERVDGERVDRERVDRLGVDRLGLERQCLDGWSVDGWRVDGIGLDRFGVDRVGLVGTGVGLSRSPAADGHVPAGRGRAHLRPRRARLSVHRTTWRAVPPPNQGERRASCSAGGGAGRAGGAGHRHR